eukprot:TRINITY_DN729_c0_g1_i2.p1 TRINITY_DN729_c0_g1~~TRINITY_DN729_c0_g1_i2.p1  ORF type:complete len:1598 (+),score=448.15 TRINITY_DN729_c0_g1_i2:413-5206(+)
MMMISPEEQIRNLSDQLQVMRMRHMGTNERAALAAAPSANILCLSESNGSTATGDATAFQNALQRAILAEEDAKQAKDALGEVTAALAKTKEGLRNAEERAKVAEVEIQKLRGMLSQRNSNVGETVAAQADSPPLNQLATTTAAGGQDWKLLDQNYFLRMKALGAEERLRLASGVTPATCALPNDREAPITVPSSLPFSTVAPTTEDKPAEASLPAKLSSSSERTIESLPGLAVKPMGAPLGIRLAFAEHRVGTLEKAYEQSKEVARDALKEAKALLLWEGEAKKARQLATEKAVVLEQTDALLRASREEIERLKAQQIGQKGALAGASAGQNSSLVSEQNYAMRRQLVVAEERARLAEVALSAARSALSAQASEVQQKLAEKIPEAVDLGAPGEEAVRKELEALKAELAEAKTQVAGLKDKAMEGKKTSGEAPQKAGAAVPAVGVSQVDEEAHVALEGEVRRARQVLAEREIVLEQVQLLLRASREEIESLKAQAATSGSANKALPAAVPASSSGAKDSWSSSVSEQLHVLRQKLVGSEERARLAEVTSPPTAVSRSVDEGSVSGSAYSELQHRLADSVSEAEKIRKELASTTSLLHKTEEKNRALSVQLSLSEGKAVAAASSPAVPVVEERGRYWNGVGSEDFMLLRMKQQGAEERARLTVPGLSAVQSVPTAATAGGDDSSSKETEKKLQSYAELLQSRDVVIAEKLAIVQDLTHQLEAKDHALDQAEDREEAAVEAWKTLQGKVVEQQEKGRAMSEALHALRRKAMAAEERARLAEGLSRSGEREGASSGGIGGCATPSNDSADLVKELAALNTQLAEANARVADLATQLITAKTPKVRASDVETGAKDTKTNVGAAALLERDAAMKQLSDLQGELHRKTEEAGLLREKWNLLTQEKLEIKNELDGMKASMAAGGREDKAGLSAAELTTLRKEHSAALEGVERTRKDLEASREMLAKKEAECAAAVKEAAKLRTQLTKHSAQENGVHGEGEGDEKASLSGKDVGLLKAELKQKSLGRSPSKQNDGSQTAAVSRLLEVTEELKAETAERKEKHRTAVREKGFFEMAAQRLEQKVKDAATAELSLKAKLSTNQSSSANLSGFKAGESGKSQVKALEEKLQAVEAKLAEAIVAKEATAGEVAALQQKVQSLEADHKTARREADEQRGKAKSLEASTGIMELSMTQERSRLQDSVRAFEEKVKHLSLQVTQLSKEKSDMQTQLRNAAASRDEAALAVRSAREQSKAQALNHEGEISAARMEIRNLQNEIHGLRQGWQADLLARDQSFSAERVHLQALADNLQLQLQDLQASSCMVEQYGRERDEAQATVRQLEGALAGAEAMRNDSLAKWQREAESVAVLSQRVDHLQRLLQSKDAELHKQGEEGRQAARLRAEVDRLLGEQQQLQAQSQQRLQAGAAEAEAAKRTEVLAARAEAEARFKREVSELSSRLQTMEKEAKKVKLDAEDQKRALEKSVGKAREECGRLRQQVELEKGLRSREKGGLQEKLKNVQKEAAEIRRKVQEMGEAQQALKASFSPESLRALVAQAWQQVSPPPDSGSTRPTLFLASIWAAWRRRQFSLALGPRPLIDGDASGGRS